MLSEPHQADSDDAAAAKGVLRAAARAARSALPEAERLNAQRAVTHAVLGLWDLQDARTVLAYLATPEEIDPALIVDALRVRGLVIAMPRVHEPTGLAIHLVEDDSALVMSDFGILEPSFDSPVVRPEQVDAVIVPGVVFDPAGDRIGYGGGFYDSLLPRLRGDCVKVGVAFDEQIVEEVPSQPHDMPVDVVVTPSAVYRRPDVVDPAAGSEDTYATD